MVGKQAGDGRRPQRMAARVQTEIAASLARDLRDPRLDGVTLASVDVTADLSIATVFIVVTGDDTAHRRATAACKVLARVEGGLRKRLAESLATRRVPALRFLPAASRSGGTDVERLLDEIARERAEKGET